MRSMERQALKTDAAITKLGLTLDGIGSKKQLKQLDQTERGIRNVGVSGENAAKRVDLGWQKTDRTLKKHIGTWTLFRRGVKDTVKELFKFTMLGGKLGGVVSLIGVAAQGIGALAGGVTSLLPRFGQLTGLWGAAVPLLGGMAEAAIVAKVAFGGLSQAIAGNGRALRQLAPAGQRFVKQWRSMRRDRLALTRGIQQPLFERINQPFRQAFSRSRPALQSGLGRVSGALGGVIAQGLNSFSQPGFLKQFGALSGSTARNVTMLGGGAISLAHGLTEVAMAARPVVTWLVKAVTLWTKHWAITQKVNRENGKLAQKFGIAKHALQGLWKTGKDLVAVFKTILHAATPLGNSLYGAANRSMEQWVKFHNTIAGREGLMRDFVGMEHGIRALMQLVGALGGALFKMGSQGGLTKTTQGLTKLVPALEKGFNNFANSVGPALAGAIGAVSNAFAAMGTGPLPTVLHGITSMLNLMTAIVKKAGPFKGVFTTLFSTAIISRYLVKLGLLEKGWWRVAFAARGAAESEAVASGSGGGGILGPTARAIRGGFGGGAGGLLAGGALLRGGLGALGRIAWPLALISGGFGALTASRSGGFLHQAAQTGFGGVNAATFGLYGKALGAVGLGGAVNALQSPSQTAARIVGGDQSSLAMQLKQADRGRTGLAKLTAELSILEQHADTMRGQRQQEFQDYMGQLREEIAVRKSLVAQLTAQEHQEGKTAAGRFLNSLNKAARVLVSKNGLVSGFRQADEMGLSRIGELFGGKKPSTPKQISERRSIEQALLYNAARAGQRNPKLKGELPYLESQIRAMDSGIEVGQTGQDPRTAFLPTGQMVRGSTGLWSYLMKRLPDDAPLERVQKAFTPLQRLLVGALLTNGWDAKAASGIVQKYDGAVPQNWLKLQRQLYTTNRPHAGGGRIAGHGLSDTVAVPGGMAAPGELIVNRHTEARVNRMLSQHGVTLGGMVGHEGMPHYAFATGGRTGASSYHGLPMPHAGIASLGNDVLGRFPGLSVTATTNGHHANGSYHYKGEAIDLAGPAGTMNTAATWIAHHLAGRLLEGIHNPGLSVKNGRGVRPSFWGPQTWAAHRNHIHLAASGGMMGAIANAVSSAVSGAGGAVAGGLRNLGFFDPGGLAGFGGLKVPGYGSGSGASAGAGTGTQGGASSVSATGTRKLGLQMMSKRWGLSQWPFLNKLWTRESGWNPRAKNPSSGAFGIPQALPKSKLPAAGQRGDARSQIGWGLDYIGGRYGSPSAAWAHEQSHNWYSRGGRTKFAGWFGKGGSFTTNGPALLGVGEKGREHVSVTPAHAKTSTGKQFVFAPVIYSGATQADVEAALEQAMHKFADIIERSAVEGTDLAV